MPSHLGAPCLLAVLLHLLVPTLQQEFNESNVPPVPQQLHVAFGRNATQMLVQWAVHNSTPSTVTSLLLYRDISSAQWHRLSPLNFSGPGPYQQFRGLISGLTVDRTYEYVVGWTETNQSSVRSSFYLPPREDLDWSPRLAMFGDLGWTDNQVMPLLTEESEAGAIDAMVLFGDMVYWDNGENENSFMRDMSRLSGNGSIPVMTSPGNGDYGDGGYARYKLQFGMPGWEETGSLYHFFDMGRARIIGINTEALEHSGDKPEMERMLDWFEELMVASNTKQARNARPWLVVHFHRPAYTTGGTDSMPYQVFEPLMYKYGVDLVYAGHVHNQERTLPVFNSTVVPSPDPSSPYNNPQAPVYVVSGNPGNAEQANIFGHPMAPWTAWRSYNFGYSHLTVHNSTHLSVDIIATNLGGAVVDMFTMSKTHTCLFGELCRPSRPSGAAAHGHRTAAAAALLQQKWRARSQLDGPVPPNQVQALSELFHSTSGDNWLRRDNWLNGRDPCDPAAPWFGVSCTRVTERTLPDLWNSSVDRGVTALSLPANGLSGTIPDRLGKELGPTIQYVELSSNRLHGDLPLSMLLGQPRLHTLMLDAASNSTQLTGTLPVDMGSAQGLPNLRFLGLNRNALSGSLPASLSKLPCHTKSASGAAPVSGILPPDPSTGGEVGCIFWLEDNKLTGSISDQLCQKTFDEIYVSGNQGMQCARPCVNVAYGSWPLCANGSEAVCTPCA